MKLQQTTKLLNTQTDQHTTLPQPYTVERLASNLYLTSLMPVIQGLFDDLVEDTPVTVGCVSHDSTRVLRHSA